MGYDARVVSVAGDLAPAEDAIRRARRVVIGEMFTMEGGWTQPIRAYRRLLELVPDAQKRVIFSIADDHFEDPDFCNFYREALQNCLAVTTVSEKLAETLRRLTPRPVTVAPETFEGARGTPRCASAPKRSSALAWLARRVGVSAEELWRVRLLWYGYPQNLAPLLDMVPSLKRLAQKYPLSLTCITKPVLELQELLSSATTDPGSPFRVEFLHWSPQAVELMMGSCDLVLIPSEYRHPVKQAKSPNRLVSALHGGRLPIAHPLPAYMPYREYAWVGEDLCAGIRWALDHPEQTLARVSRGQEFIDGKHSAQAVARFWLDVFESHPA
jgi:hypothetical protein